MKLSEFKESKRLEEENRPVMTLQHLKTGQRWGGRTVLREDSCMEIDLRYLDEGVCLDCMDDLERHTVTSQPHITTYICNGNPEHKFIRIGIISPMRALLDAAKTIVAGTPPITPADLDKIDEAWNNKGVD